MPTNVIASALLLVAVVFELGADVLCKQWALKNIPLLPAAGVMIYVISMILWATSMRLE
jgi:hypothetical protein